MILESASAVGMDVFLLGASAVSEDSVPFFVEEVKSVLVLSGVMILSGTVTEAGTVLEKWLYIRVPARDRRLVPSNIASTIVRTLIFGFFVSSATLITSKIITCNYEQN